MNFNRSIIILSSLGKSVYRYNINHLKINRLCFKTKPIIYVREFGHKTDQDEKQDNNSLKSLASRLGIFGCIGLSYGYLFHNDFENLLTKNSLIVHNRNVFGPVVQAANPPSKESAIGHFNFIAKVVDQCAPSVVHIQVQNSKR